MMFKPSLHGWGFEDAFTVDGPSLGLGAAPDRFGLGGGMCWAALDRYLDGRAIPDLTSAPGRGTPLHAELLQRQVAALADVWPRLRQWQSLPDGSWRDRLPVSLTPGSRDVTSLTRAGARTLRRSLAAGRPVLLTLIRHDNGYTRATAGRQVLAYEYATAGATIILSVYDPTRPGDDDVRLAFSRRGALEARLTGGEQVRAFFTVPYDREPAACVHAESFGDRTVIGLNRKVRGTPRAAPGRRGLHVVARDDDGALIHFHRRNGKAWESANITEREKFGAHELHCDPAPLAGPGGTGLHVFARSYVGDLLHFRALRRWRAANRTENRRAGARFRLAGNPQPVTLPWGGFCVVGTGKEGTLVAYSSVPFRGIRAEEVPPPAGGVIDGDPVAASVGHIVHAVARGRNGHLLHFERTKGGWSAGDLVTLCEGAEAVRSRPVLIVHEGALHLFAITADGRLLHLVRSGEGQWSGAVAADGVEGAPAVTTGPAGLHAFAAGVDGGVVHAWRSAGAWRVENVVESRAAARGSLSPSEGLVAWGSGDELRLFGRRDGTLVQWVWRADSDWVGGAVLERAGVAVRHEPGETPLLSRDRSGGFHLFATNGRGTVLHLESGAWRAASGRVTGAEPGVPAEAGSETAAEEPVEKAAVQPAGKKAAEKTVGKETEKATETAKAKTQETQNAAKRAPVPPSLEPPLLDEEAERASAEAAMEPDLLDLPLLEPEASRQPEPDTFAGEVATEVGEQPEASPTPEPEPEPEPDTFAWEVTTEVGEEPEASPEPEPEPDTFAWEVTAEVGEDPEDDSVEIEPLNLEHMESWPKGPTRASKESPAAEDPEDLLPPWPEEG